MTSSRTPQAAEIELGPLARDLPFMLRNVQARLRPEGQALRDELGIESGAVGVLSVIWQNPGISQNDLASTIALKKSAITKLVKGLEAEGLIARERVSADRRVNALTLTEAGTALVTRLRRLTDGLNDRLFDGVDPQEREVFFRVLEGIYARLDPRPDEG